MATDWKAAAAKMQHLVDVYEEAARRNKLTPNQQAALAVDLKTLGKDLAALAAEQAAPKAAALAAVPPPVVQPADPPEVVFDPSTWPPLAGVDAAKTARAGKYGEVFGSAIPGPGVYTDVQTSGGTWSGVSIPAMFYLFLRGKIVWAQEGNVDPAARIAKKTELRPANTNGLTF